MRNVTGNHPYADEFPMASAEELEELTRYLEEVAAFHGFTPLNDNEMIEVLNQTHVIHRGIPEKAKYFIVDRMWKKNRPDRRIRTQKTGHVYFIAAEGTDRIKIGYATHPKSRLKSISGMSPVPLRMVATMPGSLSDEKALHKKFAHNRTHGEWFRFASDISDYIREHCNDYA